ncbi:MAG: cell division protein ZapA [Firmicutes bacterium]|nr:cell division protein ZapA [Bacillota bacterium]
MAQLKSITIKVEGIDYPFRTANSEEYMNSLAALCDEKLDNVKAKYPACSVSRRYTLALLELADQYMQLQQEYEAVQQEIKNITEGEW